MGVPQGTVLVVTPWYCMPWGPLYQYIPVPVLEASHPIPYPGYPYLPVLGIYRYPGGLYLQYKGVLPGAPPVPPTPIYHTPTPMYTGVRGTGSTEIPQGMYVSSGLGVSSPVYGSIPGV